MKEYQDVIDFIQSQRLAIKPNPENLRQALIQGALLEEEGTVKRFWKPFLGASLAMFGVGIMVWSPSEEVQIAQDWESEFMAEMEDFYETKAELEPLYTEPLFSAVTPYQS